MENLLKTKVEQMYVYPTSHLLNGPPNIGGLLS